jgi:hypothetical protein
MVENMERDLSFLRAVARVSIGQEISQIIEKSLGITSEVIGGESKNITNWLAEHIANKPAELLEEARRQIPELKNIGIQHGNLASEIKSQNTAKKGEAQKGELTTGAEARRVQNLEKQIGTEAPKSVIPEHTTHDVNLTFNPLGSSLDQVARIFWSDPRWQEKYKEGFLYPFSN